jgi:hypothetical protein
VPSEAFQGEESTAPIHEAVGRALSMWEHAESANIKLFQLLHEAKSVAACRASYGTLGTVWAKCLAIRGAAKEFFISRDEKNFTLLKELIKAYEKAGVYRNQIAHGMAFQPHAHGYFLCPPSYSSRYRVTPRPKERWALGANYFYRVKEIDHIRLRFDQILKSTMTLVMYLNEKYSVLEGQEFHP